MKLSKLIDDLKNILNHEGDYDVIIPGDHQEYYDVGGCGIDYAVEGEVSDGYRCLHSDDVEYYKDEAIKVVSIW